MNISVNTVGIYFVKGFAEIKQVTRKIICQKVAVFAPF